MVKRDRLDKRRIIKSSRTFNELFQNVTKSTSKYFLLVYRKSDALKFGFTVSKKIRGAVKRNRAKRRLRELFRLNQDKFPNDKEIIFMAKPGVEHEKFDVLATDFLNLAIKLETQKK